MASVIGVLKERGGIRPIVGPDELLAVLERAATEPEFMTRLADSPEEALEQYLSLTQEERAAVASGDTVRIESWVGELDPRLLTWPTARLAQEKW